MLTTRSGFNAVSLALLAVAVGGVTAYASLGFLVAIAWLHQLFVGGSGATLYSHLAEISPVLLFMVPVVGAVVVSLIVTYGVPGCRNYGPADVIQAARHGDGKMSVREGLTNAGATIVSIGSGASVGRYGPVVHLGATLAVWLAERCRLNEDRRKTILACGVAGAISASFSAPLAGVVFAHEVVMGRFSIRSVMPIVISSVVATTIAGFYEITGTLFALPDLSVAFAWEYLVFAVVGAVGGSLAVFFMATMRQFNQMAQHVPGPPVIRALCGGALLGIIIVVFPETFGLGERVIQDALSLEMTIGILLLLVFAKLLATSVSFAAGFSGGVFGPALFIGTMMGTAIGLGVHELTDAASSPAVYGVAGMGAVISRVIGSPIATILLVFELTGSYTLMTAVMVSVVVGGTVTGSFFNHSYFYYQLRARGVNPEEPRIQQRLREIKIKSLTIKAPVVLSADVTVQAARDMLIQHGASEAYVVDDEGRLLGRIDAVVLLGINDEASLDKSVACFLSKPHIVLYEQMNLLDVVTTLRFSAGNSLPVIDDDVSRQLVGVVDKNVLMQAVLRVTTDT